MDRNSNGKVFLEQRPYSQEGFDDVYEFGTFKFMIIAAQGFCRSLMKAYQMKIVNTLDKSIN